MDEVYFSYNRENLMKDVSIFRKDIWDTGVEQRTHTRSLGRFTKKEVEMLRDLLNKILED